MKCLRVPKTVIICIICIVLLNECLGIRCNETVHSAQQHTFDAAITSNQEEYCIYEEIIATFNFSSHVTDEDYFAFAISEDISFNPIFQSEPIQGNFSVSEIYKFSLLSLNYSFLGSNIVLYLLLYYIDNLFENNICSSKVITINKADLECDFHQNFTQIEEETKYNVTFRLYDSTNTLFVLQEEEVTCWILFDNEILESFTLLTSYDGHLHFQVESIKRSKTCEILLMCNSSKYFNSAQFSFQLDVLQTRPDSNQIIISILVIISVGIACTCFIYVGILIYKKKLKRNYTIREIKI